MKQGFMFYVLPSTWHKIIIFGLCITFAKSLPSGPRLIKVNVSFDVTFLYETMFYVLCFTIYLTQISTLLDQNCANY